MASTSSEPSVAHSVFEQPSSSQNQNWIGSLLMWFEKEQRDFPWRRKVHVYQTWVCEIMSQQTTLGVVLPKYREFMAALPTVQSLAVCSEAELRKLWAGLGYYARARNLQKGAQFIVEEKYGNFPTTYEGWLEVPGCGPYSASVISSICFSARAACVDGNVIRVVSRLLAMQAGVWEPAGLNRIQEFVAGAIPSEAPGQFNQAMMELGALVCKKQNPLCNMCPVSFSCQAYAQGSVLQCPPAKPRKAFVDETVYAFVVKDRDTNQVALLKRGKGFLSQTVGFPIIKGSSPKGQEVLTWAKQSGVVTLNQAPKTIAHTITNHRIQGVVLAVEISMQHKEEKAWLSALSALLHAAGNVDWHPESAVESSLASALDQKLWQLFADFSGRQNP